MARIRAALITGASSGIGQALALALADPSMRLHLAGRDAGRLEVVAKSCRQLGATVATRLIDVRDADAMADWIIGAGPLDLVVANAGIAPGTDGSAPESPGQSRAVFGTNMEGVLNTVLPAMQVMRTQPVGADGVRGRIAAIASIAAFIPASPAPSYCASKAAVDSWMVATARSSRAQGIRLTSVCPGFIRTPMTEGKRRWMPGLMAPDRAARIILRGIAAGRVRVAFPWWLMAACRLAALLPPRVFGTLAAPRSTEA